MMWFWLIVVIVILLVVGLCWWGYCYNNNCRSGSRSIDAAAVAAATLSADWTTFQTSYAGMTGAFAEIPNDTTGYTALNDAIVALTAEMPAITLGIATTRARIADADRRDRC